MRVLILGAGGFIGTNLLDYLIDNTTHDIIGLDVETEKIEPRHFDNPRFTFHSVNITRDRARVRELIGGADVVIDLIAYANPSIYLERPLDVVRLNYDENLIIVDHCVELKRRLIQFSSCEVYGMTLGSSEPLCAETTPLIMGPVSKHRWIYASAKQLLERIVHANGLERGLDYTIVRPFNFIGPKIDYLIDKPSFGGPRVFSHFFSAFQHGWPVTLVDGGVNRRCYTYIGDAVTAIALLVENGGGQFSRRIVNVGNPGNECTIRDLAVLMHEVYEEESGKKVPYEERIVSGDEFYGEGYQDSDRRVPVITKLRDAGWEPAYDLDATVRASVRYYLDNT